MRKLTLREIQMAELEIAKDIASFCENNQIGYFLSSGSLLGAVRHGGFIPWDDDMDMYMFREDYDRFCRSYTSQRYILKYCENGTLHAPFAKVCNPNIFVQSDVVGDDDNSLLWVDIFPLDGLPNSKRGQQYFFKYVDNHMRGIMLSRTMSIKEKNLVKRFIKIIRLKYYKSFKDEHWITEAKKISCFCRRYKIEDAKYLSNNMWHNVYPKEIFMYKSKYMFENTEFVSVKDYDQYLKICYGNYMKLPPEDKRGGHYLNAWSDK